MRLSDRRASHAFGVAADLNFSELDGHGGKSAEKWARIEGNAEENASKISLSRDLSGNLSGNLSGTQLSTDNFDLYPNTKAIPVLSNVELVREFEDISKELFTTDQKWSSRVSSIRRIEGLYLGSSHVSSFSPHFRIIVSALCEQLNDRRYVILKEIFHLLTVLAESLKCEFKPHAEKMIPAILQHLSSNVCTVSQSSDKCIQMLIENCCIYGAIPKFIEWGMNHRNNPIRIKCIEYADRILCNENYFYEVRLRYLSNYEHLIKSCIGDNLASVRTGIRRLFISFTHHDPLRSQFLFSSFSPSIQKAVQTEVENMHPTMRINYKTKNVLNDDEKMEAFYDSFDFDVQKSSMVLKSMDKNYSNVIDSITGCTNCEIYSNDNNKKSENGVKGKDFINICEAKYEKGLDNVNQTETKNRFEDNQMDSSLKFLSNGTILSGYIQSGSEYSLTNPKENTDFLNHDDTLDVNDGMGKYVDDIKLAKDDPMQFEIGKKHEKFEYSKSEDDSTFEINVYQDEEWLQDGSITVKAKTGHGGLKDTTNSLESKSKSQSSETAARSSKDSTSGMIRYGIEDLSTYGNKSSSNDFKLPRIKTKRSVFTVYPSEYSASRIKHPVMNETGNPISMLPTKTESDSSNLKDCIVRSQFLLINALNFNSDWITRVEAFRSVCIILTRGEKGTYFIQKNFGLILCLLSSHLNSTHPKVTQSALECLGILFPQFSDSFVEKLEEFLPSVYVRFADTKTQIRLLAGSILVTVWNLYTRETLLPSLLRALEPPRSVRARTCTLEFGNSVLFKQKIYIETSNSKKTLCKPVGDLSPISIKKWIQKILNVIRFDCDSNSSLNLKLKNAALSAIVIVYSTLNSSIVLQAILDMPHKEQSSLRRDLGYFFPLMELQLEKMNPKFSKNWLPHESSHRCTQHSFPATPSFSMLSPRSILFLEQKSLHRIASLNKNMDLALTLWHENVMDSGDRQGDANGQGNDKKSKTGESHSKCDEKETDSMMMKKGKSFLMDFPNMNDSFSFDFESVDTNPSHSRILESNECPNVENTEKVDSEMKAQAVKVMDHPSSPVTNTEVPESESGDQEPDIELDISNLSDYLNEPEMDVSRPIEELEKETNEPLSKPHRSKCSYIPKLLKSRNPIRKLSKSLWK